MAGKCVGAVGCNIGVGGGGGGSNHICMCGVYIFMYYTYVYTFTELFLRVLFQPHRNNLTIFSPQFQLFCS
jgi:hypothetical protein